MKIGLLVDDTLDKPDGVQQYVLAMGGWMSEQGHEVHYLAGETKRTDLANIHSMARNIAVTFNGNKLTIPLPVSRRKIRELFDEHNFDVLHVMSPHSPLFAQRVICLAPKSTTVISTFHILPHSKLASIGTRLLGAWLRPSLRRIKLTLAVSQAAKEFADRCFGTDSQVLPNVIHVDSFKSAEQFPQYADKPTILFLGRLVARKGCVYLLQAVDHIVKHKLYEAPFRVLICGKGELSAAAQQYVADHDLTSYVEFTGFVSEADKPRYIASSDIAVYPSTGGESFGIVLLEAMAATRGVVLGGNNPGYATVLSPRPEQLFDPRDTAAFAALMADYLRDETARFDAAEWQREYVQQFDVNVVGTKLLKAYESAKTSNTSRVA